MDWPLAIDRNRKALMPIVAALFAMLRTVDAVSGGSPLSVGCADTSPPRGEVKHTAATALSASAGNKLEPTAAALTSPRLRGEVSRAKPVTACRAVALAKAEEGKSGIFTLPRRIFAAILLILRPAESALRRLIVIAARGLKLKPRTSRPLPFGLSSCSESSARTPSFNLFDPLKHFDLDDYDNNARPNFNFSSSWDQDSGTPHFSQPDQLVNASQLFARMRALRSALHDIPAQARRLARWRARRDLLLKAKRPTRVTTFRPGLPPGWRQRSIHEVDDVLKECHGLAIHAVNTPDTG